MSSVLSVVGADEDPTVVADVSDAIAEIVGAQVQTCELPRKKEPSAAARTVLDRLEQDDNLVATLRDGADRQPLCWEVVRQATKPVVLVPPRHRAAGNSIGRALVPLDGSAESSGAVTETVDLLTKAGVDVVVLHVFDTRSVPPFWDHPTHAADTWRTEFLARHCTQPGVRMELRNGAVGENVLDVARTENVDLIVLGWSQQLDEGRALTVQHIVGASPVPVMLVPLGPEARAHGPLPARRACRVLGP